jgi:hypothetical protein
MILLFRKFVDEVRVELRTVEHGMAQEGLDPFQPHPALQQMCGNRVA